jgi:hypothetical protein
MATTDEIAASVRSLLRRSPRLGIARPRVATAPRGGNVLGAVSVVISTSLRLVLVPVSRGATAVAPRLVA